MLSKACFSGFSKQIEQHQTYTPRDGTTPFIRHLVFISSKLGGGKISVPNEGFQISSALRLGSLWFGSVLVWGHLVTLVFLPFFVGFSRFSQDLCSWASTGAWRRDQKQKSEKEDDLMFLQSRNGFQTLSDGPLDPWNVIRITRK